MSGSDAWIKPSSTKTAGDRRAEFKRATTNYRLGLWAALIAPILIAPVLIALFPDVGFLAVAAIVLLEAARCVLVSRWGRDCWTPGQMVRDYLRWCVWARRWTRALVKAGAANPPVGTSFEEYIPGGARVVFMSVHEIPAGLRFKVRHAIKPLLERHEVVQEKLNRSVRIDTNPLRPGEATVTLRLHVPFETATALRWPWLDRETIDAYEPVPIALDEDGNLVTLDLADGSLLVGGLRRKGKSVLLQLLCAVGALADNAELWIMDRKGNELLPAWAPVAAGYAKDPDEAVEMLTRLRAQMLERLDHLARLDPPRRKVERGLGIPLNILVVDELAYYTDDEDGKTADAITRLLREIVSLGGAAGIPPIVATQKPSVDMIPSKLRDQFAYAAAFPSKTPEASDTILGKGSASRGYDASTMKQPGVAIFDMEEGEPRKGRVFFLTDEDIASITARAQMRPGIKELEQMLANVPARDGEEAKVPGAPGRPGGAPGGAPLEAVHESVLRLVAQRPGELSKSAIEREIPMSGRAVRELLAWGMLVRRGEKRHTRYWPVDVDTASG